MKRKYLRKMQIRTDVSIPKGCKIIQVINYEIIGKKDYKPIIVLNVWAIVEVDKE